MASLHALCGTLLSNDASAASAALRDISTALCGVDVTVDAAPKRAAKAAANAALPASRRGGKASAPAVAAPAQETEVLPPAAPAASFELTPRAALDTLWPTIAAMLLQPSAASHGRAKHSHQRTSAYLLLSTLSRSCDASSGSPAYLPLLTHYPLFWRAIYFGIRVADDAIISKSAVAVLRGLITYEASASTHASWLTYLTLLDVLADFPATLAAQVWAQMGALLPDAAAVSTRVHAVSCACGAPHARDANVLLPCASWYDHDRRQPMTAAATGAHAAQLQAACVGDTILPCTTPPPDRAFLTPATIPRPDFTQRVPLEWACALIDRAAWHDNATVRRLFVRYLLTIHEHIPEGALPPSSESLPVVECHRLLYGAPPVRCVHAITPAESRIIECIATSGSGSNSGIAADSAPVPIVFRLPPWYVVRMCGGLAAVCAQRHAQDSVVVAVQRFLALYVELLARGDAARPAEDALLPSFVESVLALTVAHTNDKGFIRTVLRAFAFAGSRTARWGGMLAGAMTARACSCLRASLIITSHMSDREFMLERYIDAFACLLSLCNPVAVPLHDLGLTLACIPAAVLLSRLQRGIHPDSAEDGVTPVLRWLAPHARILHPSVRDVLTAYGRGDGNMSAAAIARIIACMPGEDASTGVWARDGALFMAFVGAPWIDTLASIYSSGFMHPTVRTRALRLLCAVLMLCSPDSPAADAHMYSVAPDVAPWLVTLASPLLRECMDAIIAADDFPHGVDSSIFDPRTMKFAVVSNAAQVRDEAADAHAYGAVGAHVASMDIRAGATHAAAQAEAAYASSSSLARSHLMAHAGGARASMLAGHTAAAAHLDSFRSLVAACVVNHAAVRTELSQYLRQSINVHIGLLSAVASHSSAVYSWEHGVHAHGDAPGALPLPWLLRALVVADYLCTHARAASVFAPVIEDVLSNALIRVRSLAEVQALSADKTLPVVHLHEFINAATVLSLLLSPPSSLQSSFLSSAPARPLMTALLEALLSCTFSPPASAAVVSSPLIIAGSHVTVDVSGAAGIPLSWGATHVMHDMARWGAMAALLRVLQSCPPSDDDASALCGLPLPVANALVAALLSACARSRVEHTLVLAKVCAFALPACISTGEPLPSFEQAWTWVHGQRAGAPIASASLEDVAAAFLNLIERAPDDFAAACVYVQALSQRVLLLRPCLHAGNALESVLPAERMRGAGIVRRLLQQAFTLLSSPHRSNVHVQLFAGTLVCEWAQLLVEAEHAETSATAQDLQLAAVCKEVLLSHIPLLCMLLLHAESVNQTESATLSDAGALHQVRCWYASLIDTASQDFLDVHRAPLKWRGAGALTRVQALLFVEHASALAIRARTRLMLNPGVLDATCLAFQRALMLRLTRALSLPALLRKCVPGSVGFRTRIRCVQALAVVLHAWGLYDRDAILAASAPSPACEDGEEVVDGTAPGGPVYLTQRVSYHTAPATPIGPLTGKDGARLASHPHDLHADDGFHIPLSSTAAAWGAAATTSDPASAEQQATPCSDARALSCVMQDAQYESPATLLARVMNACVAATEASTAPSMRTAMEALLLPLSVRFPSTWLRTYATPALLQFDGRLQCVTTASYLLCRLISVVQQRLTAVGVDHSVAVRSAYAQLMRAALHALLPWNMCMLGAVRAQAQVGIVLAVRGLFSSWFVPVATGGDSLASLLGFALCEEGDMECDVTSDDGARAWLRPMLRYLFDSRESVVMLRPIVTSVLSAVTPSGQSTGLASLLALSTDDHGEFVSVDVFERLSAAFRSAASARRRDDPYLPRDIDCIHDSMEWMIAAGLLPAAAVQDESLRAGFDASNGTLPFTERQAAAASTGEDASFNIQRKALSALQEHSISTSGPDALPAALLPAPSSLAAVCTLTAESGRRCQPLIVCASLIDKATNAGGLARTCEIFGAQALVLPHLAMQDDPAFKSVAVGAGDWMTLYECSRPRLVSYLRAWRARGYVIVGLEQAARSQSLHSVEFPDRVVLVLGAELTGMPPDVLQELDMCIEIPQLGLIRSLNVHVSAALTVWTYTQQRLRR